ncbi:hypothetical protein Gotur_030048 [Gossypium turneri]
MENGFFDKVEDNAAVQACVTQNRLQELKKSGISRMMGSSSFFTLAMEICLIFLT